MIEPETQLLSFPRGPSIPSDCPTSSPAVGPTKEVAGSDNLPTSASAKPTTKARTVKIERTDVELETIDVSDAQRDERYASIPERPRARKAAGKGGKGKVVPKARTASWELTKRGPTLTED